MRIVPIVFCEIMTSEGLAPSRRAPAAAARTPESRQAASTHAPQPIPSDDLLRGQASVTIDHAGIRYVLRATRAGKLILTK
jgi:hemin uptake protein HemP